MRSTWKGCTRMRRWKASLPACLTMYLLAAMRAASRASEVICSFSQLQGAARARRFAGEVQPAERLRTKAQTAKLNRTAVAHASLMLQSLAVASGIRPGHVFRQQQCLPWSLQTSALNMVQQATCAVPACMIVCFGLTADFTHKHHT